MSFWEPVLTRIQNRLSGWKSRFLSFGGHLILLKSVLTSLPVYALSFFKAPSDTISSIESLLNKFFWAESEEIRKSSWISWKTICLRKEYGGFGVRKLREFNNALLGKWCWRMMVDRGGLWFRVLAARYGEERGCVSAGGRSESSWWREIVRIRDGVDDLGDGWFGDCVLKKRLLDLAVHKWSTVAEIFSLGWGTSVEASAVGVRGGDVVGVSGFTSQLPFEGSVSMFVAVAARSNQKLLSPGGLSDFDFLTVTRRDVNLHPLEWIPAGIAPFGDPKTEIFLPWGRGWRQNFPLRQFGVGTGD
ncbi:hypothetical protein TSUD_63860 [Trifolium subterraneum]|uniref:Reverse transcriptase zinc-binding domain-containing protein n=1 Tax=Trifolium subterraneum TaxID=3900 RepID=A0A2Z6MZA2_TRISU|nr:hypothetical protein TSUD_63860 [Trifolium subterraneum]